MIHGLNGHSEEACVLYSMVCCPPTVFRFLCVFGGVVGSSHLASSQWYSCYRTGQARTDQHRVLLAVSWLMSLLLLLSIIYSFIYLFSLFLQLLILGVYVYCVMVCTHSEQNILSVV